MKKRVLINVEDKDIRVAIMEDNDLCQLFVEQLEDISTVGNVYKGRVEGIVQGLQAAFINIGMERNAFLHFADIRGDFQIPGKDSRSSGRGSRSKKSSTSEKSDSDSKTKSKSKKKPELQVGDSLLVQVTKEPISTKGARVTSNISLPGRYLVLLPFSNGKSGGVSRRIQNVTERRRLRDLLKSLDADDGGFIIRTAGLSQDEDEISADVKKLKQAWQTILKNYEESEAPSLIYNDHSILGRIVRDELTLDVSQLVIDSKTHARRLRDILGDMMPDLKKKVSVYSDLDENIFEHYDIENQYQKALRRKVWMKSGGYIIVDETEALISIDVNSGKFVGKSNQEDMIYKVNLEAADTVARQLRLRDMGGIIVVDFIDMKGRENQKGLVREFKKLLAKDRAKTTVENLSELGLLEMTRKRVRESLSKVVFKQCPYCQGFGRILTEQQIWKNIKYEILGLTKKKEDIKTLRITVHPAVRTYLENEVLEGAKGLANRCQAALCFDENKEYHLEQFEVESVD